jgi:pantoate--beta-alanine ligase
LIHNQASHSLQIVHHLPKLRERIRNLRQKGGAIALVPTMGALHAGHLELIAAAKRKAEHAVVSIFVNPRQFGPNEDLDAYPRPADEDVKLLQSVNCDLLWMPGVPEVYPEGYATNVSVAGLGKGLCGAARPGHFDGVATIVAKLFNQVRPDMALFGEKDWQQLAIIRRMAIDLDLGVEVIGCPIVREEDGLAISSRNRYLTKKERKAASALPRAMADAVTAIEGGAPVSAALAMVREKLSAAGFSEPDYVSLAASDDLKPLKKLDRPARLFVAARLGKARLIDNWAVNPIRL